jgi:hypothetical protein
MMRHSIINCSAALVIFGLAPTLRAEPAGVSAAQAALATTSQNGKHMFILFYKEDNAATQTMWQALHSGLAGHNQQAACMAVRTTDPNEQAVVNQLNVSRAPLPLVLGVAPNGAITGGFVQKPTPAQLAQAIVSPALGRCLKAVQDRKLVLLCVHPAGRSLPTGVVEFQADPQYHAHTVVVTVDPTNPIEAPTLARFQVGPVSDSQVTLFLVPPGSVLGRFDGNVTREQLATKLQSAQAGCCPGGKCGPGGCCPGGKCGPNGCGPNQ